MRFQESMKRCLAKLFVRWVSTAYEGTRMLMNICLEPTEALTFVVN